ncbi:MAG: hypothetical protein JXR94_01550 [Candidatus Hydrogenedentes bacterium]|nr:hypothetical protein [Candidatus Hydrogenedentota bacterium]
MKTDDFTVVETSGGPVERAGQFGEAVRANYAAVAALFEPRRALLDTPQGQRVLANVRTRYLAECADILPHMKAFAKGLDVDFDALLELNILVMLTKSRLEECTGVIVARGDHVVVGQNWDTGEKAAPMAVLDIGRGGGTPATARFTSPLTLDFWAGVNPYGLATGGCSGPSGDPIGDGMGITGTLWRGPVFYRCKSVADVKALVESVPIPGKGPNTVYVDAGGAMLWVQQGGGHSGVVAPETPYCAATGYRPLLNEPRNPKEMAEYHRWERFMLLAKDASECTRDLVACVKAVLADHCVVDDHPDSSPCRHGGPDSSTQFSLVFDLTARTVHYCGRPCENPWRAIEL